MKYDRKTVTDLDVKEYPKYIKGFKELYLNLTNYDVFQLRNSKLSGYLICNEKFRQKVNDNKLYGIDFIELSNLGALYESTYNYGQIEWNRG